MREIHIPIATSVNASDDTSYQVRVIGHERADGIWEGVIEFANGTTRRVTRIETTQPDSGALEDWATGLESIYFEGALKRARKPGTRGKRAAMTLISA